MFKRVKNDIQVVFKRDPASRSMLEAFFLYPGLHAIWIHRVAHWLWNKDLKTIARWISYCSRHYTGIEIHPGAKLSEGLFIDHGMGIVIGETAEVGLNVTIYQGVTLGGVSWQKGKRHPTVEEDVVIGAGAKVLGNITIGKGSRIGANSVVVKSVPSNSVVVGVPGQIIKRSKEKEKGTVDLENGQMPDAIGTSLSSIFQRLEILEKKMEGQLTEKDKAKYIHAPENGIWHGEDFMI